MTVDLEQNHCALGCTDTLVGKTAAMNHARLMHPDLWDDELHWWPDGEVIVYDETGEM